MADKDEEVITTESQGGDALNLEGGNDTSGNDADTRLGDEPDSPLADKSNIGADGQPINTDPLAAFRKALGEVTVKGQPVQIESMDQVRRWIQQAHGSAESAAMYNSLRKPYEWLNEQLADEKSSALFTEFKQDPELLKTVASWIADPKSRRLMDHMRHNQKFSQTLTGWIDEWEKSGDLDPRLIDMGKSDIKTRSMEAQLAAIADEKKQNAEQRAIQTEREELFSKVNEYNNGTPFTKKQLGTIVIFRDGMRKQSGYEKYTFAQALKELVDQKIWQPEKKVSGPGAPVAGKSPVGRAEPGAYAEEGVEAYRERLMAAF